eukprot:g45086.t1
MAANGSFVPFAEDVFSIEVLPDDPLDSAPLVVSSQLVNEVTPSVCGPEEPLTILTVILDADLTKMTAKQRIGLLEQMRKFAEVGLHQMKLVPVVNNRLFDMSAFMAGPGNAKKVVENGALVSWKIGFTTSTKLKGRTKAPRVTSKPSTKLRTTSPPTRRTTSPVHATKPFRQPVGDNRPPKLSNHIDRVDSWVGTYFEVKIPSDTFYDHEDGTTDKLQLTLKLREQQALPENSWVKFNGTSQLLYGLPDSGHEGKHEYFMHAADKGGLTAVDAFEVHVHSRPHNGKSSAKFAARFHGDHKKVANDVNKKIQLIKKLAYAFGDRNSSTVTLHSISKGSIVVEWTNNTLPLQPCPEEQIQSLSRHIADSDGKPSQVFTATMEPEFSPINVSVSGTGSCKNIQFVPAVPFSEPPIQPTVLVAVGEGPSRTSNDDVYLHTVIPAVVVAAILLIAGIIAMICYRKKRKGKLTIEDQATFIKKGVPIIFADELDDSKPPPSSSVPLILQEEKPPLPPPEYPSQSSHEAIPLGQDLIGEYTPLREEDPNAPPYQPPPPFTAPME